MRATLGVIILAIAVGSYYTATIGFCIIGAGLVISKLLYPHI